MTLENAKDKIRKLLRVAENDAATDGEIENAMRAAQALMHAYHLSEEEVKNQPEDVKREIKFTQRQAWTKGARLSTWEIDLIHFICKFLGTVQWYYISGSVERRDTNGILKRNPETGEVLKQTQLTFFGPADEVELALEMLEELQTVIYTMARLKYGTTFKGAGRSYAEGFTAGLQTKLKKVNQQLTSDSTSRALVVQSNAIVEVVKKDAKKWLQQAAGIKLRAGDSRERMRNDSSAYGQGKQDGMNTDVTANRKKRLT